MMSENRECTTGSGKEPDIDIDLNQDREDFIQSLNILNDFAGQFFDRKEYNKSAIIDFKILGAASRILGLENEDTLRVMENLAVDYTKLGKLKNAVETYKDLIEYRKHLLGAKHPDTLKAINGIAGVYAMLEDKENFDKALDELAAADSRPDK